MGQLCAVACLLLSIQAEKVGVGSEKAQSQMARVRRTAECAAENCKQVSQDQNHQRSKNSSVKKTDDDILSFGNSHTKGQETEGSRKERERRRRKRRKRRKKLQRRRGGEQVGGRRRRKKHLREEEANGARAELKAKERMRRRRRLYEEQKEFQR